MQNNSTKIFQDKERLGRKDDPLGIMQEILTIIPSGIYINQKPYKKLRRIKFSEILKYKRIP